MSIRWRWTIAGLVASSLGLFVASHLEITTDMTRFMYPRDEESPRRSVTLSPSKDLPSTSLPSTSLPSTGNPLLPTDGESPGATLNAGPDEATSTATASEASDPQGIPNPTRLAIARKLTDSALSRSMVLVLRPRQSHVDAIDAETLANLSRDFETALRSEARVASAISTLDGGPMADAEQTLWSLYAPRSLALLADDPAQASQRISDNGLREAAQELRRALAGPMSSLVARLAPQDPFLTLVTRFERLAASTGTLSPAASATQRNTTGRPQRSAPPRDAITLSHGRFLTQDGTKALLFLRTHASAFDAEVQGPLLEGIEAAFRRVNQAHGEALTLDMSGINRFATRAAQAIRGDMQRVTVWSIVLLSALLLIMFRSLRLLALASIPLGAGMLLGTAAVLALFGHIHALTLAVGASLLGVSLDYVAHLYTHHVTHQATQKADARLEPNDGLPSNQALFVDAPASHATASHATASDAITRHPGKRALASLRAVRLPLVTGCLTTLVGFLALGFSELPGLQQIACFASVGIVGALLSTCWVLPYAMPDHMAPAPWRDRVLRGLRALLHSLRRRRALLWAIPLVALAWNAVMLPRVGWNQDFAGLTKLDPALVDEDARVRAIVQADTMRFVVAFGDTEEEALIANDQAHQVLQQAVRDGHLDAFRSLASLLPSARTQRSVARVALDDNTLPQRLTDTFESEGFQSAAFAPFFRSLRGPAPSPLRFADLAQSPLKSLVTPFRVPLDREGMAFVTYLGNIHDETALEAALRAPLRVANRGGPLPSKANRSTTDTSVGINAFLLKQSELMGDAKQHLEQHTLTRLLLGVCAVFLVLLLRYRKLGRVLASFLPSVLAALTAVTVLAALGFHLDLVVLTGLLMIISMGVDYGVFLVDASLAPGAGARDVQVSGALLSILLACVSTLIGFGALSLSEHPVLASLGTCAFVGMLASLLLAPTALLLSERPS